MKKLRADGVTAAVSAAQASFRRIDPPSNVPLTAEDLPFFANVIAEFARAEWTAHQLELAALLARDMADLTREQETLRTEGFIAVRENGTTVENPRMRVCNALKQGILAQRRSLSLNARAKHGEARDIGKRRGLLKDSEIEDEGDDLLARPN